MAKKKQRSENRAWLAVQKETAKRVKRLRDKRGDRSYDDTVVYLLELCNHVIPAAKA